MTDNDQAREALISDERIMQLSAEAAGVDVGQIEPYRNAHVTFAKKLFAEYELKRAPLQHEAIPEQIEQFRQRTLIAINGRRAGHQPGSSEWLEINKIERLIRELPAAPLPAQIKDE